MGHFQLLSDMTSGISWISCNIASFMCPISVSCLCRHLCPESWISSKVTWFVPRHIYFSIWVTAKKLVHRICFTSLAFSPLFHIKLSHNWSFGTSIFLERICNCNDTRLWNEGFSYYRYSSFSSRPYISGRSYPYPAELVLLLGVSFCINADIAGVSGTIHWSI